MKENRLDDTTLEAKRSSISSGITSSKMPEWK